MKPPRPLEPGPVPEPGPIVMANDENGVPYPEEPCDCEEGEGEERLPIPGIIWWPEMPAIPDEPGPPIQKVEGCGSCERYGHHEKYSLDEAAARVVAAKYGLTAVFLEDRDWDIEEADQGHGYGCFGVINPAATQYVEPKRPIEMYVARLDGTWTTTTIQIYAHTVPAGIVEEAERVLTANLIADGIQDVAFIGVYRIPDYSPET